MADDSWKDGYDAWKLRSPYEDGEKRLADCLGPSAPEEIDEIAALRVELSDAMGTIAALREELDAATKWAAEYERQHGPFKPLPAIPDFMIPF